MLLVGYLLLGAVAGLTAGLFGVGGGLIIVPALVFAFSFMDFPATTLTQLAVGTSLATIVFTSVSSVRAHHEYGNVDWRLFWKLAPAIAVGVVLGVHTAAGMAGQLLQGLFGCFALLIAAQMGLGLKPKPSRVVPGRVGLTAAGGVIGYVSALFGIGGGSLTVPFLSWSNVVMQKAVGVSAACGLPIAIVGFATNIWAGWGREDLPAYSSGFVYWPAFLGVVLTSTLFARFGAKLAQRLPEAHLKRVFALFLVVVGVQFIYRNF
ncbi:sulfite exporter TauE/SafE family protein [Litorivivens sp.]|uniref:sulfite exporter TauE/SafE family protein n=1 Tax=Litorivivens sp. TaxID=2020868 RepID=UPI0035652711